MPWLERIGLAREEDEIDAGEQGFVEPDFRIAHGGVVGGRLPIDEGEGARDVGVARHRHPRLLPDEVQHPAGRQPARRRLDRRERLRERAREALRGLLPPEDRAEEPVERGVVAGGEGVGDDDVGGEGLDGLHVAPPVLVHVDDDVGGREPPQPVEPDRLRASDPRDRIDRRLRMDAERGAAGHGRAEPEVEEQLRDARDEGDDPGRGPGPGVLAARVVGALRGHRFRPRLRPAPGCAVGIFTKYASRRRILGTLVSRPQRTRGRGPGVRV